MEVPDPFHGDIPDFGDEAINLLAENFARGVETSNALASIDSMNALLRAISTLDEPQLRVTLIAMTLRYRSAADPGFKMDLDAP